MPRRRRQGKNRKAPAGPPVEVTIDRLGGQGDGVAAHEGRSLFVPLAAPGDRVRVAPPPGGQSGQAILKEILTDSPDRVEPPCPHFDQCGGCAVQHVSDSVYQNWKAGLLREAFSRRDLDPSVIEPMVTCPPSSRRRVRLHARRAGDGLVLGFLARRSKRIIPITSCSVARDSLVGLLDPLRQLLSSTLIPGEQAEISVLETNEGIDLTLHLDESPDLDARELLTDFASTHDIARISRLGFDEAEDAGAEPVLVRRAPSLHFGSLAVTIPPGGFAQATEEGEDALRGVVMAALTGCKRVVDFFSGCGAFSLPLAEVGARVHSIDRASSSIDALLSAARAGGIGNVVTGEARDLERRPFLADDFSVYDGVVLDPPRSGAEAQATHLAESSVPVIAYVSCNPVTFARDAQILLRGGYELRRVLPVDQFLWSPHLELVSVFRKPE